MGWGAIIGLTAVATGMWQYQESKRAADKAAREAKEIARRNARAIQLENIEIARRTRQQSFDRSATTRALAGATGLTGLSHQRYIERLEREALREADWIQRSSILQQEKELRAGMAEASNIRARGRAQQREAIGQIIGGATQVVASGGIDTWISQNPDYTYTTDSSDPYPG